MTAKLSKVTRSLARPPSGLVCDSTVPLASDVNREALKSRDVSDADFTASDWNFNQSLYS